MSRRKNETDEQHRARRAKERHRPGVREAHLERMRGFRRRQKGFTVELLNLMRTAQQGKCAICTCGLVGGRGHNSEQADHCHSTGKPRGLLCLSCNVSLGFYEKHQRTAGLVIQPYEDYAQR